MRDNLKPHWQYNRHAQILLCVQIIDVKTTALNNVKQSKLTRTRSWFI